MWGFELRCAVLRCAVTWCDGMCCPTLRCAMARGATPGDVAAMPDCKPACAAHQHGDGDGRCAWLPCPRAALHAGSRCVLPPSLPPARRPGCTRLTVDVRLPRGQAAAAAATRDAASLLHALRVPRALGSAATNATVLQCALGGLARAPAGGGAAEEVPAAPPCLAVRPACIALPPDGQPWQLLGLQLLPAQEAGWDLGQTTVLARQSGAVLGPARAARARLALLKPNPCAWHPLRSRVCAEA